MLVFERLGNGVGILKPQAAFLHVEGKGEGNIDRLFCRRLLLVQFVVQVQPLHPLVEPDAQRDLREFLRLASLVSSPKTGPLICLSPLRFWRW